MRKNSTIKDVAKKAGVSTTTVSFVLNRHPGEVISDRVRRRVWAAARALDYHANAAAAGLARKRTRNVAIIFYKDADLFSNQFYSFVIQGAIKQAIESEYNLLFSYINRTYEAYADLPKVIQEKNAEGVLLMRQLHPKMVRDIRARGIPVVAVDHYPELKRVDSLRGDNRAGGRLAVQHLLELGHQRLSMLYATPERPSIGERLSGFREALVQSGRPFSARSNLCQAQDLTFDAGYTAALRLLRRKRRPTGLFCANDEMAAGALRAAHALGLRVPEDVSVVGFDDINMARYTDPPLTTVGGVKESMGRLAMARLLELVEGGDSRIQHQVIDVRIIQRHSTCRVGVS